MENKLSTIRQWLISDQHEYGEFGKHEIVNPTDLPRTLVMSQIKPNIYTSIIAYSTLCVTGEIPNSVKATFFTWIEQMRSESGYWTSASGKTIPFCSSAWARNNNLRHTAKCLDFYLLCEKFGYQDAMVFNDIISCQLEDGSFPQFKGMGSDLWSTVYFANLLIRATMERNLKITLPRDCKMPAWKKKLNNRLNRAIDWLLDKQDANSLWSICGADSISITLAMMASIGGYLALHKPDDFAEVIRTLISLGETSPSFIYVSCLGLDALKPEDQAIIMQLYNNTIQAPDIAPKDFLDVISLCKLHFINKEFGLLLYYRDLTGGHESQMVALEVWNRNEYLCWTLNSVYCGKLIKNQIPLREADFWEYINKAIERIKHNIEDELGWKVFWNKETHVGEDKVQIYFDGHLKTICESDGVMVNRETETGHGPVDFSFSNLFSSKCLLEIKLSSNAAIRNWNFLAQIHEYAKGLNVFAAFLVIVSFDGNLQNTMNEVNDAISSFRSSHNDFYLKAAFIDASKKTSASKVCYNNI